MIEPCHSGNRLQREPLPQSSAVKGVIFHCLLLFMTVRVPVGWKVKQSHGWCQSHRGQRRTSKAHPAPPQPHTLCAVPGTELNGTSLQGTGNEGLCTSFKPDGRLMISKNITPDPVCFLKRFCGQNPGSTQTVLYGCALTLPLTTSLDCLS